MGSARDRAAECPKERIAPALDGCARWRDVGDDVSRGHDRRPHVRGRRHILERHPELERNRAAILDAVRFPPMTRSGHADKEEWF